LLSVPMRVPTASGPAWLGQKSEQVGVQSHLIVRTPTLNPVSTLPAGGRSLGLTTFDHRLQPGATSCDLSELRFIDAYGLVGTACALLAAAKEGGHPPIDYPGQGQVCEHLSRMGFRDLLRELGYPIVLPETAVIERPDVLVPLTRTDHVFGAEQLSHLLHEQLRDHADPQVLEAILEGLWELAANALEHSGSEAVIMGQVYREGDLPHHRNRVQVAIGDAGIGIRRSFLDSERRQPHDDLAAIDLALEYLVTSVDDPGRGQGLFTAAEQVTALEGHLVLRSGTGRVTLSRDERTEDLVPLLAGTLVCMSLPLYPGES